MALRKNTDTEENKKYWDFVEKTAHEVSAWPEWMRGASCVSTQKQAGDEKPSSRNSNALTPDES
jgi:hypothetical protein